MTRNDAASLPPASTSSMLPSHGAAIPDLIAKPARDVVDLLLAGEVTPLELVQELAEHVPLADAEVNALPIRFFEQAAERATRLMEEHPDPADRGLLAGLPIAVKDYNDVAGQRTTFGSPLFARTTAAESDAMVRTLERNGAIPYAKTNVPEFAGGHTYNTVFGATRNPWNPTRSAGGSSGGSAAALAAGSAWLATGNDLGGSLRTPAGFNGVVGIRPTPGLIPRRKPAVPFDTLWVEGPMARDVADAALMLDAMVGHDPHDPLTAHRTPASFRTAVELQSTLERVAFSPDLGFLPVDPTVRRLTRDAMRHVEHLNTDVVETCPDFSSAFDTFQVLRAHLVATLHEGTLVAHRESIKPDIIWNIEKGLQQPLSALQAAERSRGELIHRVTDFFTTYDALIVPSAPLPPFPVEWTAPDTIDGVSLDSYVDWIGITFCLSLTGCPVVALPCGLSEDGLPIGIQVVGPPGSEHRLLSFAHRLEQSVGIAPLLPLAPTGQPASGVIA